jgi:hypothetical protein
LINLSKSGADVFYNISTGKASSQSIRKAAELGWKPLQLLSAGSVGRSIVNAAGLENAKDIVAIRYSKEAGPGRWEKDKDVMAFEALRGCRTSIATTPCLCRLWSGGLHGGNPATLRRRPHPRQRPEAGLEAGWLFDGNQWQISEEPVTE